MDSIISTGASMTGSSQGQAVDKTGRDLTKIVIEDGWLQDIFNYLVGDRLSMMQIEAVRSYVAQQRYLLLKEGWGRQYHDDVDERVRINTLQHNEIMLEQLVGFDRPSLMLHPLRSITALQNRADKKVLSIGPRTEIELLGLVAAGFKAHNISTIDLFSYSPLIKTGDIHKMNFADNSFDVITCGWVLAYSKDPVVAVREMVRVAKPGAFISVGCDYNTGEMEAPVSTGMGVDKPPRFSCAQDIIDLFGVRAGYVAFKTEPVAPYDTAGRNIVVVVQIAK
jgi:SAM-dependent methyltransferase